MAIDLSEEIRNEIITYFAEVGLLPDFSRTQSARRCSVCGEVLVQNLSYEGKPNGFKTHGLAYCIQNFRSRIEELENK